MDGTHPLTAYRQRYGLSKSDLGKRIGVTRVTVWRWEERKQFPERSLWNRIRKATNDEISITDFEPASEPAE